MALCGIPEDSVDGSSLRIADLMSVACDVSAKKLRFRNNKRGVYWWSDEVAGVKRWCTADRRLLTRRRRRGRDCEELEDLYKKARRDFVRR